MKLDLFQKMNPFSHPKNDLFINNKIDLASFVKKKFYDYPKIYLEGTKH